MDRMDAAEMRRDMKKEGALCQWGLCGNPNVERVDGHALCPEHRERYEETDDMTTLKDVLDGVKIGTDDE